MHSVPFIRYEPHPHISFLKVLEVEVQTWHHINQEGRFFNPLVKMKVHLRCKKNIISLWLASSTATGVRKYLIEQVVEDGYIKFSFLGEPYDITAKFIEPLN